MTDNKKWQIIKDIWRALFSQWLYIFQQRLQMGLSVQCNFSSFFTLDIFHTSFRCVSVVFVYTFIRFTFSLSFLHSFVFFFFFFRLFHLHSGTLALFFIRNIGIAFAFPSILLSFRFAATLFYFFQFFCSYNTITYVLNRVPNSFVLFHSRQCAHAIDFLIRMVKRRQFFCSSPLFHRLIYRLLFVYSHYLSVAGC